MGFTYCTTCDRVILSNAKKYKVSFPSIMEALQRWSDESGKELEDWMVICSSCHIRCSKTADGEVPQFKQKRQYQVKNVGNVEDSMEMQWEPSENTQSTEVSMSDASQPSMSTSSGTGLKLQATRKTQSQCFLCKSPSGRSKVPGTAIMDVWVNYSIYISPENRCCQGHVTASGKFDHESINDIKEGSREVELTSKETAKFISMLTGQAKMDPEIEMKISFALESSLSNEAYKMLTGLERWQFDDLFTYCQPHLRTSSNRSPRDALAIFLIKLRLDLSQEVLSFLFSIDSQSRISETIASVMKILEQYFLNKFLGYQHLPREKLIFEHTPNFVKEILNASEESAIVVMDGTYLFIEKSSNLELQKKTFSMHKMRNLVKPMMVVAADGYIIHVEGPYFADGGNNDASILLDMMRKSGFSHYFVEDDEFVLDRGFRDAISTATEARFRTSMPSLLGKKEKQFSAIQANNTRRVTMVRWVVESVNGRIKNVFKLFKNIIPITYLPKLGILFKIACAISNAYFVPLLSDREEHKLIAQEVLRRAPLMNTLQIEVEPTSRKEACWEEVTEEMPTFPYLTEDDLKMITLGIYQVNMAPAYCAHHLGNGSEYKLYVHKENETLLRAKIESRFVKTKKHTLWIEFDSSKFGHEAITRWYCKCYVGARIVGTCSHVASVLWYLGYGRFIPGLKLPNKSLARNILDARRIENGDAGEEGFGLEDI